MESWLGYCLRNEKITNVSFRLLGTSQKGENYMGNIFFVYLTGTTEDGQKKDYNLVVKHSTNSKLMQEVTLMKIFFQNEIYMYDILFPDFAKFQKEKKVEVFDSIPKCYGTLDDNNTQVLVFKNMVISGYNLWDRRTPMTRQHLELVLREYARFHSISLAMQDQEPERYKKLTERHDIFNRLIKDPRSNVMIDAYKGTIEEMYQLLKDDLEEEVSVKWRHLKEEIQSFFVQLVDQDGVKVVSHGDCCNNSFLFYYDNNGQPIKVSIIDWQIAKVTSPVTDLSHFLFSCISGQDLEDLETLLEYYHECFLNFLEKMGSDKSLYPKEQFFEDWKRNSKFGIILSSMVIKICCAENEVAPDAAAKSVDGEDLKISQLRVANKELMKSRMKAIVGYVVEKGLI